MQLTKKAEETRDAQEFVRNLAHNARVGRMTTEVIASLELLSEILPEKVEISKIQQDYIRIKFNVDLHEAQQKQRLTVELRSLAVIAVFVNCLVQKFNQSGETARSYIGRLIFSHDRGESKSENTCKALADLIREESPDSPLVLTDKQNDFIRLLYNEIWEEAEGKNDCNKKLLPLHVLEPIILYINSFRS